MRQSPDTAREVGESASRPPHPYQRVGIVMANRIYRDRIRASVESAMREYRNARAVDHPGIQGRIRELALGKIVRPLLFEQLSLGTGKITDYCGNQSSQIDGIIYSTMRLPSVMYDKSLGVFPIDAVMAAIEVKSVLTATEIKDCHSKAASLWRLHYSTGSYTHRDGATTYSVSPLLPIVFAFQSDLTGASKSELERYLGVDAPAAAGKKPAVWMICVVGRGCWWYRQAENGAQWVFHSPTPGFDEVIDFVAVMFMQKSP